MNATPRGNGTCSWDGSSGCDQADADILCKLITDDPNSTAISWTDTTALAAPGFSCPRSTYGTLVNTDRGLGVSVYFYDGQLDNTHGSGDVVANPVCR